MHQLIFSTVKTFEIYFVELQVAITHEVYSTAEIDALKILSQSYMCCSIHTVQKKKKQTTTNAQ